MQPHVKNYFKAFGHGKGDYIGCEHCGQPSVDIHHIESRSHFGAKSKDACDDPSNLIALCRECHDKAHGPLSRWYKEIFKDIVNNRT